MFSMDESTLYISWFYLCLFLYLSVVKMPPDHVRSAACGRSSKLWYIYRYTEHVVVMLFQERIIIVFFASGSSPPNSCDAPPGFWTHRASMCSILDTMCVLDYGQVYQGPDSLWSGLRKDGLRHGLSYCVLDCGNVFWIMEKCTKAQIAYVLDFGKLVWDMDYWYAFRTTGNGIWDSVCRYCIADECSIWGPDSTKYGLRTCALTPGSILWEL